MTDEPKPWIAGEAANNESKRHAPATLRNRDAIAQVLAELLPSTGLVLEIASGSGEHICHFAATFPNLRWLPSDPDPAAIGSISAWVDEAGLSNLAPPMQIDAATPLAWPVGEADAVLCINMKSNGCDPQKTAIFAACLCINMVHISDWKATEGLFRGCASVLKPGAPLYLYGPYFEDDVETAPSNLAFDRSLRERNAAWGLRNVRDVDRVAEANGFSRERRIEMPANNLSLIYRKG